MMGLLSGENLLVVFADVAISLVLQLIHDGIKHALTIGHIITRHGDTDHSNPLVIESINLGDRNLKLAMQPILDTRDNTPFIFERSAFVNHQFDLKDANYHRV
jgi:hypothetical protein